MGIRVAPAFSNPLATDAAGNDVLLGMERKKCSEFDSGNVPLLSFPVRQD
ncbi:hypothetical protein KSK55_08415 [Methanospirillum purgamenti]|uniref:Uncharacterized protein n=1 Tax=Methanospirillum hungatei TaxID=2203 RepID=A0A8F5ZDK6_METHU|nr:hypothetical protein [Methanospirillum hungatei]QXO93415.1 hypothetical protein KSK55_08415 [Methanospirillum hungatei]